MRAYGGGLRCKQFLLNLVEAALNIARSANGRQIPGTNVILANSR
jgi:hypothetical protein